MDTEARSSGRWWAFGSGSTAGLAIALGILLAIGGAAFGIYYQLVKSVNHVEHTYRVLRSVDGVLGSLRDAETGQRGYLLTRDAAYLDPYRAAVEKIHAQFEQLDRLVSDDAPQRSSVAKLAQLSSEKIRELNATIQLSQAGKGNEALQRVRSGEGKALMDEARKITTDLRAAETRQLEQRRRLMMELRWLTGAVLGAVLLLGTAMIGGVLVANAHLRRQRDRLEREIAARKVAQIHLLESREQYRTTLSSIGDGVIATDALGRVTFMNRVAETLTGWTFPEAETRPIQESFRIVNEATRHTVANPVDRVLREGKVVGLANHTVLIAKDGSERPIDDSGAPIRNALDEVVGAVLVFRDISERKRFEEERQALLENEQRSRFEVEQSGRAKDEFLANLSHELRTPLNAIVGWTQLLKRGAASPDEQIRAIDTIDRNARLQAQLIADLLEMSAIVSGKLRVELKPIELGSIILAVVDSAMPNALARPVRLEKRIEPAELFVMADQVRMQQIVWNLLSNAFKFTPAGGLVTVELRRNGASAELVVSDTGQGISRSFLPSVFDRFRQEDSSLRRKHGGLGLGLAIVKQLVEAHGGTVTAASGGEGQGATFTVTVPLYEMAAGQLRSKSPSDAMANLPALHGLRVVVVDDDDDGRELLARILKESGCQVRTAASAVDGLEQIRTEVPDLLISDISMPGVDGYEFLSRVRGLDGGVARNLAAIALTGFARPEDSHQAELAGYAAHLSKPMDPDELLRVVAETAARSPPSAG